VADRAYLSIGEVLSLLKEEFPDATISKIRFLESQGLIDPERTPSGYRKFYESDVERLRWILRQQREHFLPLKVIKGRLGPESPDEAVTVAVATPAAPAPAEPGPVAGPGPAPEPAVAAVAPDRPRMTRTPAPLPAVDFLVGSGQSSANLTLEELAAMVELPVERLAELEKYGLLAGKAVGGTRYYDDDAKRVAELAAGFLRFGVEARHLRMYKSAAEREAGFFEQIVMPLLKQRNPQSRRQAVETLGELARLGQELRGAMLRQALQDYTSG
jgi:DNA-binding transcriptional MerR regulator